jgi:hypothetical protein
VHLDPGQFVGAQPQAEGRLDHGRPAHPDRRARRADHTVGEPGQAGVTGEGRARHDGHRRHPARQLGHPVEELVRPVRPVELEIAAADPRVTGPAAATVDEEHHRPAVLLGQGEQPLEPGCAVAAPVVGVVGRRRQHDLAVDRADEVHPTGLGHPAAVPVDRGDRAVGHRTAGVVEQRGEPFPGGELAGVMDTGHGLGPGGVEP